MLQDESKVVRRPRRHYRVAWSVTALLVLDLVLLGVTDFTPALTIPTMLAVITFVLQFVLPREKASRLKAALLILASGAFAAGGLLLQIGVWIAGA